MPLPEWKARLNAAVSELRQMIAEIDAGTNHERLVSHADTLSHASQEFGQIAQLVAPTPEPVDPTPEPEPAPVRDTLDPVPEPPA